MIHTELIKNSEPFFLHYQKEEQRTIPSQLFLINCSTGSYPFVILFYSFSQVNVEHIDRFADEFGAGVVEDDKEQNELSQKVQDYENSKAQKSSKPSDFQALFGANNNDHFMIGIKFTR